LRLKERSASIGINHAVFRNAFINRHDAFPDFSIDCSEPYVDIQALSFSFRLCFGYTQQFARSPERFIRNHNHEDKGQLVTH